MERKDNKFKPDAKVLTELKKPCADKRLSGLWKIVGDKFETEQIDEYLVDNDALVDMLTHDSIAYDIMINIIIKKAESKKVFCKQIFCNESKQKMSDITDIVCKAENPLVIVHPTSKYVVVLADNKENLDLYFWNMYAFV